MRCTIAPFKSLFLCQIEIYKQDFESERKDRENAHSKVAALEVKVMELTAQLAEKETELAEARKESKKLRNVPIIYCIILILLLTLYYMYIKCSVYLCFNIFFKFLNRKVKNWNRERQTEQRKWRTKFKY